MDVKIFNVEHGFCATVDLDNHHTILIDCGYNFGKGFSPGMYLVKTHHTKVDCLILPVYSTHHLEGFSDLITQFVDNFFTPKFIVANPSVSSQNGEENVATQTLNNLGIGNVLKLFAKAKQGQPVWEHAMNFDDLHLTFFWNDFGETEDLDDLSLVTFLSYRDVKMIFPGDLKVSGWKRLLEHPNFVHCLRQTNLFVASTHGEPAGYCPEIFQYCHPQLVIISNDIDHPISEDMLNIYANHTRGIEVGETREKLLSTHRHGTLTISRYLDRRLDITVDNG